jgi:hypothetical protein
MGVRVFAKLDRDCRRQRQTRSIMTRYVSDALQ